MNQCITQAHVPKITAVEIAYPNDFSEWYFYDNANEDAIGSMQLRYKIDLDWSIWDFRIGENTGEIKMLNKPDPNIWVMRSGSKILTMKTIYRNDFSQWRVTDDSKYLSFQTSYPNIYDGWKLVRSNYGSFEIYTNWEMDPTAWIIYDLMDESIEWEFKIALSFIATYFASPKY